MGLEMGGEGKGVADTGPQGPSDKLTIYKLLPKKTLSFFFSPLFLLLPSFLPPSALPSPSPTSSLPSCLLHPPSSLSPTLPSSTSLIA